MPPQQNRGWVGTTDEAVESTCFLGGKWWAEGDKIACLYLRSFETKYGTGREFSLVGPRQLTVTVDEFGIARKKGDGKERIVSRFAMPPLAGFEMAVQVLQNAGFENFRFGDSVIIECTGIQPAIDDSQSDMPKFKVSVDKR